MERQTWAAFPVYQGEHQRQINCLHWLWALFILSNFLSGSCNNGSKPLSVYWHGLRASLILYHCCFSVLYKYHCFYDGGCWTDPLSLMFYFCQPYLLTTHTCSCVSSTYPILLYMELLSVCTDSIYVEHNHYALSIIHHIKPLLPYYPLLS